MITMNKELLIRMPAPLYREVKKLCGKKYKPLSAFIRDLLIEQVENSLRSGKKT